MWLRQYLCGSALRQAQGERIYLLFLAMKAAHLPLLFNAHALAKRLTDRPAYHCGAAQNAAALDLVDPDPFRQ